jgi:hypothetical protein
MNNVSLYFLLSIAHCGILCVLVLIGADSTRKRKKEQQYSQNGILIKFIYIYLIIGLVPLNC